MKYDNNDKEVENSKIAKSQRMERKVISWTLQERNK